MPKFMIALEEQDDGGALTDRFLEKIFERDFLPQIGSHVIAGGTGYEVVDIEHDYDIDSNNDRAVIVRAPISCIDFDSLRSSDSTWIFHEGYIS